MWSRSASTTAAACTCAAQAPPAMICGDLDGALTFSWPDEEWDYEAAPEGREACEAARWEQFSAVLTTAGFLVPATVRDLSELYLTWGPARREETPDGTRWSIPAALPLPDDLLRLDPVLTERLDGIRRAMRIRPVPRHPHRPAGRRSG